MSCIFSADFPFLTNEVTGLHKALYNHLRKSHEEDEAVQAELLHLSTTTDSIDNPKMNDLRKQIASNSQQVKLYHRLRQTLDSLAECSEILAKESDPELKSLAESEMEDLTG